MDTDYYFQEMTVYPLISEQVVISDFLDKKTSEIDSLIADKEKLIKLLEEQRLTIITEAVTKGLDLNVEMKDSGIEWIGEIPEHWELKKLKFIANLKSGQTINQLEIDEEGDYPVFGGNGRRGFTKSFTHNGYFVLIGRQGAQCGNIHLINGKFWASEHAIVVTIKNKINIIWLTNLLKAMNLNQYSESAAQPGISVDKIKNLSICIPSYSEQERIAGYITKKILKIDLLIEKIIKQKIILNEYRQSLIFEAVTGKIDVRDIAVDEAVTV